MYGPYWFLLALFAVGVMAGHSGAGSPVPVDAGNMGPQGKGHAVPPTAPAADKPLTTSVVPLDGDNWLLATDAKNAGREQQWYRAARPEAKRTKVPWIIQDAFPGYHGVAWYWRTFAAPANPHSGGRYLLRFEAVDYLADVWVNGVHVGGHEGGEGPFVLDVTDAVKQGADAVIAVRVLNPTHDRIDGIVLNETPHRCKVMPYSAGAAYNHGGITGSVELLVTPAVRVEDMFVRPDGKTGIIRIQAGIRNAGAKAAGGRIEFAVAPAASGGTLGSIVLRRELQPGETTVEAELKVDNPHLWDLNDPFLYRVTARVTADSGSSVDEHSVRCGFRDLRFENGYFRLNGRRIFLRSTHTCNHYPIGLEFAHESDLERRDMLNVKVMGFNMVRFIWGGAKRSQLDLADEIGLMVYNESYAGFPMADSPKFAERFDNAISAVIRRDRNHPCVTIWGLLNEVGEPKHSHQFRRAVASLAMVRRLDDSRLVMLNSGRWDRHFDIGSLSNPGSDKWECLMGAEGGPDSQNREIKAPPGGGGGLAPGMGDIHYYPRVPQLAEHSAFLRTLGQGTKHVFLTEYGIGSAVDLWRTVRHFERLGKESLEDGQFYNDRLRRYLADYERWRLEECFARPVDFFAESLKKMAGERTRGLNAIRANPHLAGYSLTGMIDHVMTGEGLTTPFRELKPGTIDAMFDGWAPLRLCLFAEPVNVYRGAKVALDAMLANEDALAPGEYPIRLQVVGPDCKQVFDRTVNLRIPDSNGRPEPDFALPVFAEKVNADWPSGQYRFLATFERGAAAAGGETVFHVADAADMPKVEQEVVLWGEDQQLAKWLSEHGIRCRPFSAEQQSAREVILVGNGAGSGGAESWKELARHVARGSVAVFLSHEVFAEKDKPLAWLPLANKGELKAIRGWLYLKDEWAKRHPIFAGLPAGGLMDYTYYREIIPDIVLSGQDPPAEAVAGAIKASQDYASGLTVSVYNLGQGWFILNTLRIRDNLGQHPAAEHLLRNMLRYATGKTKEPPADLPADFNKHLEALRHK